MPLVRAVAVTVVCSLLPNAAFAGEAPPHVALVADGNIWETSIAISPANPANAVVIGILGVGGGGAVRSYYTFDRGQTWQLGGQLGLTTPTRTYARHGDPVVTVDRHGTFYVSTLIGYPRSYPLTYSGVAVFRSTDGGRTWEGPFPVVERAPEDRPRFADDKEWIGADASGGPFDGNVYVSWLRSEQGNPGRNESVFARSTDGGVTWSEEMVLGPGSGAQISIGPNGEVHLLRTCGDGFYCSQVSLDGGVTFAAPVRIARSGTFLSDAADRSPGPHRGNVYIAWIASFAGPQLSRSWVGTLYFARSTDGGQSWEEPVAITPVGAGTALFQTIASDPVTGDVVLMWLDRRENPSGKQFRLYMIRSTDGGATFSEQRPITPAVDMTATGFIGDYNQTAAYGGLVLSAFSDGGGRMSVARMLFELPPPAGPRRRAVGR